MNVTESEKCLRMGKNLNFINYIVLSNGEIIRNMNCDLNANIPTNEELKNLVSRLK